MPPLDSGTLVSAAAAIATTVLMVIALRRQVRKDAEAARGSIMREIRAGREEMERRQETVVRDLRSEIRTVHERIDRKEVDRKEADAKTDHRVEGMQERIYTGISALEGEMRQIRTQIAVIQRAMQVKE